MGRVGTGMTIATLTLAAAVFSEQVDACSPVVYLFVTLTVLVCIGTIVVAIAPRTRWLHAIPLIGAPRVRVKFALNGSPDLKASISAVHKPSAELQVGIETLDATDLQNATVTLMIPIDVVVTPISPDGLKRDDWQLMPPYGDELKRSDGTIVRTKYIYATRRLSGRSSILAGFKLTFPEVKEYPIRLKIEDNALQPSEGFVEDALITIANRNEDSFTPKEIVSDGIDAIEAKLSDPNAKNDDLVEIVVHARFSVPPDMQEVLDAVQLEFDGPEAGPDYRRAMGAMYLSALYQVRRMLGE